MNAARIGLYCGTHMPFTVRSSGRDMFIQFRSDVSNSLRVSPRPFPPFHSRETLQNEASTPDPSRALLEQGFHAVFEFERQGARRGPHVGDDALDLDDGDVTNNVFPGEGGAASLSGMFKSTKLVQINKATAVVLRVSSAALNHSTRRHTCSQFSRNADTSLNKKI